MFDIFSKFIYSKRRNNEKHFPRHRHAKYCYELHYVTHGHGTLVIADHEYRLGRNSIYITGPEVYHMQLTEPGNEMCEYYIFFKAEIKKPDLLTDIFLKQDFWAGRGSRKIRELFNRIYELLSGNTLLQSRQAVLYIQILILEPAGLYQPHITHMKSDTNLLPDDNALAVDWFFLDCKKETTIGLLADSLGLSVRQTQRFLKEKYGMTFREKKAEMQLEHAKLLLLKEKCPLAAIADECGFCNVSAFSDFFFRKKTGMTPVQYRTRNK